MRRQKTKSMGIPYGNVEAAHGAVQCVDEPDLFRHVLTIGVPVHYVECNNPASISCMSGFPSLLLPEWTMIQGNCFIGGNLPSILYTQFL